MSHSPDIDKFHSNDISHSLVDIARYPIHDPKQHEYLQLVNSAREQLRTDGCTRISQFIRLECQPDLLEETTQLESQALFSVEEYTPYGTSADSNFAAGHPRANTHRTTSGNVTRDLIPTNTLIQKLYSSPIFQRFIADCLEIDEIHQFRDPMRGLIINAMPNNTTLGWHFDANEFVVSLMTKHADAGGEFEYCPAIRAPGAENYNDVKAVLAGDRQQVKVLDLQVGDIQLFKGRFALHRVAPTIGRRHTVVFGYSAQPGYIGNAESTQRVYGRVMQEHIDADHEKHVDGLTD